MKYNSAINEHSLRYKSHLRPYSEKNKPKQPIKILLMKTQTWRLGRSKTAEPLFSNETLVDIVVLKLISRYF